MILEFIDNIPVNSVLKPVLISGSSSIGYSNNVYLKLYDNGEFLKLFEIKYNDHCSPFQQSIIVDDLIAVGHEENFYLFNFDTNKTLSILKLNGYFGHLYFEKDFFYVADAEGLYCIEKNGKILWNNNELGIDGVIIHEFTPNRILGSGEFDPPGGWVDFSIDKATGLK